MEAFFWDSVMDNGIICKKKIRKKVIICLLKLLREMSRIWEPFLWVKFFLCVLGYFFDLKLGTFAGCVIIRHNSSITVIIRHKTSIFVIIRQKSQKKAKTKNQVHQPKNPIQTALQQRKKRKFVLFAFDCVLLLGLEFVCRLRFKKDQKGLKRIEKVRKVQICA